MHFGLSCRRHGVTLVLKCSGNILILERCAAVITVKGGHTEYYSSKWIKTVRLTTSDGLRATICMLHEHYENHVLEAKKSVFSDLSGANAVYD